MTKFIFSPFVIVFLLVLKILPESLTGQISTFVHWCLGLIAVLYPYIIIGAMVAVCIMIIFRLYCAIADRNVGL